VATILFSINTLSSKGVKAINSHFLSILMRSWLKMVGFYIFWWFKERFLAGWNIFRRSSMGIIMRPYTTATPSTLFSNFIPPLKLSIFLRAKTYGLKGTIKVKKFYLPILKKA
jgi:hypothetical protein